MLQYIISIITRMWLIWYSRIHGISPRRGNGSGPHRPKPDGKNGPSALRRLCRGSLAPRYLTRMGGVDMDPLPVEKLSRVAPQLGYAIRECFQRVHLGITCRSQVIFRVDDVLDRGGTGEVVLTVLREALFGIL